MEEKAAKGKRGLHCVLLLLTSRAEQSRAEQSRAEQSKAVVDE